MGRVLARGEGVTKAFGGRTLLDGAAFQVEVGERVAIVGPNGSGKSTLLGMLAGRVAPDHGAVTLAPHVRLAYFEQNARLPKGAKAKDVLASDGGLPPEVAQELAELEARMADPALYESGESDAVLARYGDLQRDAARLRAQAGAAAADSALFEELGFTDEDLDREVASLSGGERTRLLLVKTLAQADPDGLLVLDEPTNHLDVETIEWLEGWLAAYPGGVLLVAHDRAFLDNVATRILALEHGRLASYPGDYTNYERQREEDAQRRALQREREQKELERQKAVIEQFRHQKRFDGQMASRLTRLAKYRSALERDADPLVQKLRVALDLPATHKSSQDVVRVRGLGKRFGERILFYGLDLDLLKGDRVALVGANGAGKTTLLRILVGKEKKDVGNVEIAPGVKGAYFAQGHETLEPERTLRHEVLAARPGLADEDVRALLGRFGFRHDHDPMRKVATLSGGERSRLQLLKTVLAPSNLLILDEPTNHLDLDTRVALVRALNAYDGTLLVVSHDRWFLDSIANKVAVLARRQVKVFAGDLTSARTVEQMGAFTNEKPTRYLVRKAFKDYDSGTRHTVGSTIELTEDELQKKRLYRTALSMGWMEEEP